MPDQELQRKNIDRICKCNREDQDFLIRYFSRQPLTLKINVMERMKKLFHSLKQKFNNIQNDELSYAAIILAIRHVYALDKMFTKKKFEDLTLEEIRDISTIKIEQFEEMTLPSSAPKRDKLLHYWASVKQCRTLPGKKPMSFQKISKYLEKKYHFKVGHNLISEIWRELEE